MEVEKAKATGHDRKLYDGGGLLLLVRATGGKWWRFNYTFAGKKKTLSMGTYPEVSLAAARTLRTAAREQVAAGIDPGVERKTKKQVDELLARNSFETVARAWHAQTSREWKPVHTARILSVLEKDVFPYIGKDPLPTITAPQILEVVKRIATRDVDTAHRTLQLCSRVYRYAIGNSLTTHNIVRDLGDALPKVRHGHLAAPTDPKDIGPILRAIDAYHGGPVVKSACQLAPLLFVRPGELRSAEWSEIDLDAGLWSIPAEKMKMGQPHIVPLARQAVAILKQLHQLTGHGRYVFPGGRTPNDCMGRSAVGSAFKIMGLEKSVITPHGFRAMARTLLDEVLNIRPDFIEHQLAHKVKDPNGRAYNRTSHQLERQKMMQTWADYLDQLKAGTANIYPLRFAV